MHIICVCPSYSYLVTDINEMQALVIVEHEGDFYNLYLSDESGIYYSLSLRDIVIETTPNLQVDLELVGHAHTMYSVRLYCLFFGLTGKELLTILCSVCVQSNLRDNKTNKAQQA